MITAHAVNAFLWVKNVLDRSSACGGRTGNAPQPIYFITTLHRSGERDRLRCSMEDHLANAESNQEQLGVDNTRRRAKRDLAREKLASAEETSKHPVLENKELMYSHSRERREAQRTSGVYRRQN